MAAMSVFQKKTHECVTSRFRRSHAIRLAYPLPDQYLHLRVAETLNDER